MGTLHTVEVFDRAPVLLGPRNDLHHVRQNPIAIGTVLTVNLLDEIEIGQMTTIKGQII